MKKCRQKHGGFWALLTPLGTYGNRYLPLTNRDAIFLTKSLSRTHVLAVLLAILYLDSLIKFEFYETNILIFRKNIIE